jgi:hypothetical protein
MRKPWGFLNIKRVRAGEGRHKYVVTCGLHGGAIHYTSAHKSAQIANRYALKHEKEHTSVIPSA